MSGNKSHSLQLFKLCLDCVIEILQSHWEQDYIEIKGIENSTYHDRSPVHGSETQTYQNQMSKSTTTSHQPTKYSHHVSHSLLCFFFFVQRQSYKQLKVWLFDRPSVDYQCRRYQITKLDSQYLPDVPIRLLTHKMDQVNIPIIN